MLKNKLALANRFDSLPALVAPEAVNQFTSLVAALPLEEAHEQFESLSAATFGFSPASRDGGKPFAYAEGVAFIGVYGMLLHRYQWSGEYATGYNAVRDKLDAALADPDVKGIVFDINSPGGQVAGNFELADAIYASRGQKKTIAIVDGYAASGGYSLASSAEKIVASRSSRVGSIGVVMMHADWSKAMKDFGVEITFIYAGKHKIDGNAYQPLPEDVQARFQASVDKSYTEFVNLVARNRAIEASAVRKTEASVYDAEDAKRMGLIDAIDQSDRAIAAFRKELSGSSLTTGGSTMSHEDTTPDAAAVAAPAAPTAAAPAAAAPTADEIKAAERTRVAAILNSEEAKGRDDLAKHLASTDLSAEQALAILAKAPKAEAAAAGPDALTRMMDGQGGGAGLNAGDGENREMTVGERIIANAAAAGLPPAKAPAKAH